ncbi:hypothetical protein Peur_034795 [Populus x canadensis]
MQNSATTIEARPSLSPISHPYSLAEKTITTRNPQTITQTLQTPPSPTKNPPCHHPQPPSPFTKLVQPITSTPSQASTVPVENLSMNRIATYLTKEYNVGLDGPNNSVMKTLMGKGAKILKVKIGVDQSVLIGNEAIGCPWGDMQIMV